MLILYTTYVIKVQGHTDDFLAKHAILALEQQLLSAKTVTQHKYNSSNFELSKPKSLFKNAILKSQSIITYSHICQDIYICIP